MICKGIIQPLISPQETITLLRENGTVDTIDIAIKLCYEWRRQTSAELQKGSEDFNFACMLAALFDAGRIQGIREERQKRAHKAAQREAWNRRKEEALDNEQATA